MAKGPRRRARSSRSSYKRRRRHDARRMVSPRDPENLVSGSDLLGSLWNADRDSGAREGDPENAPDRD